MPIDPAQHIYVETRNGRDGTFFAVACDLCEWWDDENDTYPAAVEVGEEHVRTRHSIEQTLRELVDAAEAVAVYPEGAVGLDDLTEATERAKKVLGS